MLARDITVPSISVVVPMPVDIFRHLFLHRFLDSGFATNNPHWALHYIRSEKNWDMVPICGICRVGGKDITLSNIDAEFARYFSLPPDYVLAQFNVNVTYDNTVIVDAKEYLHILNNGCAKENRKDSIVNLMVRGGFGHDNVIVFISCLSLEQCVGYSGEYYFDISGAPKIELDKDYLTSVSTKASNSTNTGAYVFSDLFFDKFNNGVTVGHMNVF
jgi:hypothetical protein